MSTWEIQPAYFSTGRTKFMQHSKDGMCGYTCKVKDTQTFHCYSCGEEIPQPYVDVILLGNVHFIEVSLWACPWT